MYAKRCAAFVLFVVIVVIVGLVDATENYVDYGGECYSFSTNLSIHYLLENMQ